MGWRLLRERRRFLRLLEVVGCADDVDEEGWGPLMCRLLSWRDAWAVRGWACACGPCCAYPPRSALLGSMYPPRLAVLELEAMA